MAVRTVAVIGASQDRRKFGNKSVRAHLQQGFEVYPVHPTAEKLEGLTAYANLQAVPVEQLDRVTVYVPPHIGMQLLEDIRARNPREVWFNPGSESEELIRRALEMGLNPIQACSIVDVGISPGELAEE